MKEQKKRSLLVSIQIIAIAVFLNGCLIRTYTVTKDRPDQEVSGNQGFLSGQAPANYQQPKKFTQRRYKFFEVELQSPLKIEHLKEPPKSPEENTDTAPQAMSQDIGEVLQEGFEPKTQSTIIDMPEAETSSAPLTAKSNLPGTYIVKNGDTLQKISARPEIYGTHKQWVKIYKANQDRLKAPDRIKPGQELIIPRD
ncbi:MAG: LysM peptidoglycan-binding domain-containing protein [Candidatus Omnitrophota bacterium]